MVEKKGYKQTEIGSIPEDWEVKRLSVVADVIGGGTPSTSNLSFWNGYINWFTPTEVGKSKFISESERKITNEGLQSSSAKMLPIGTILLTSRATIGDVSILKNEGCTNQGFQSLIAKKDVNNEYLYYKLLTIKNIIISLASGSTFLEISPNKLRQIEISIPILLEQTAIAAVLSDMDEYIATIERLIAKKKALKKGAMQKLLSPQITQIDAEKKNSENLRKSADKNWEEKKLGEILDYEQPTNYIVKNTEYVTNGIPVLTAGKTFILGYTNETDNIFSEFPVIIFDDFTTATQFVDFSFKVKSSAMKILKLKDKKCNLRFIFEVMQMIDFPLSDHQRYWISEYRNILVKIPSFKEQNHIATILSDMDAEIEALQAKLSKAKLVKQGAMQELLTGKIRLVNSAIKAQSLAKPQKQANVYFKRSVWAAEIADRLCGEPTFGHVKMEKSLFLTENMCGIDIGSNYHRDAAGPYDNRAIRSIDSQLKKQNWFEVVRKDKGYRYIPLSKRGGHKDYFNKYYSNVLPVFEKIINTLRSWDTERCEIVATLYSAWKDLADTKKHYTDNDIINEVVNNWNESKKRIPEERWQKALDWMRENEFVPII